MSTIMDLVIGFIEAAKDLHGEYVEHWLKGKVKDYDMDMTLIEERQHRTGIYKRLAQEANNKTSKRSTE